MSIVSIILSIISMIISFIPLVGFFSFILSIIALVLGIIDLIRRTKKKVSVVTPVIGMVLAMISFIVIILGIIFSIFFYTIKQDSLINGPNAIINNVKISSQLKELLIENYNGEVRGVKVINCIKTYCYDEEVKIIVKGVPGYKNIEIMGDGYYSIEDEIYNINLDDIYIGTVTKLNGMYIIEFEYK